MCRVQRDQSTGGKQETRLGPGAHAGGGIKVNAVMPWVCRERVSTLTSENIKIQPVAPSSRAARPRCALLQKEPPGASCRIDDVDYK